MKKLLLITIMILIAGVISAQNTFKYPIILKGTTSGQTTIKAPAVAGTGVWTFPLHNVTLTTSGASTLTLPTSGTLANAASVGTQIHDTIAAGIDLGTVVPYLADTTTIVTFQHGGYNLADTAVFNDSTIVGSFRWEGRDTIVATNLIGVIRDSDSPLGTPTISVQLYWNDTAFVELGDSYKTINTSALAITSTTVGTSDTSFDNAEIPPGVWVWMRTPTVTLGRKPTLLNLTLIGHKRNLTD